MATGLHCRLRIIGAIVKVALCTLAFAMLLSLPVRAGHQFANHFRPIRVEQQIKRHTPIAQPEAKCLQRIALPAINPIQPIDHPAIESARVSRELEITENPRPVSRLLMRVKLRRSKSDTSPPLLS